MQGQMLRNSCKEEDREKKFMQKESPVVTFIQYIKKKIGYYL